MPSSSKSSKDFARGAFADLCLLEPLPLLSCFWWDPIYGPWFCFSRAMMAVEERFQN